MSTPTSVYRYLDADGVLIYVGITNRGVQRQGEHNTHAKWWRFVHSQDVEHYDDRETAMRRERYLIEKHQPPFNVVHNTDHQRRLAAYLKHSDAELKRCGHCFGCREDAKNPRDPEPYGCRMTGGEPDDYPACEVCGSHTCIYQDGINEGRPDGYQVGVESGQRIAWAEAHEMYAPAHLADQALRLIIDGDPRLRSEGFWCLGKEDAEKGLRDLQADIDEHGIAALVDKAAKPDPWAVA